MGLRMPAIITTICKSPLGSSSCQNIYSKSGVDLGLDKCSEGRLLKKTNKFSRVKSAISQIEVEVDIAGWLSIKRTKCAVVQCP